MARKPGDKNLTPQVRRLLAAKEAKIARLEGKVGELKARYDEMKAVTRRLKES